MKKITILLFLLTVTGVSAQTFDEVFNQFSAVKKKQTDYQVTLNYNLYKGIKGTKSYEQYSGLMAKYNTHTYQEIGAMVHLQMPKGFIKLNTEEKAMLVGLSSEDVQPSLEAIDPDLIYSYYDKGTLEVTKTTYKLSFSAKEYSSLPTSRIEFHLDKNTYQQSKVVIYYSSLKDFSFYEKDHLEKKTDALVDFPRLEISYSDYSSKIKINKNYFSQDTYIKVTPNKISGVSQYKNFEIILAQ
ncbi:hypothetical protein [Lacinutrix sp. Hel_I_90]|uniref:hypothetical protein n=1 Tax=Lacinutrix sp. Hel_I_90 TaxID=1249999 RepID=UPI0005C974F1|nr:hypothetical protein [Lacinutrix sp. Hel_I_90]